MKIHVSHHPLIENKMAHLRQTTTETQLFRDLMDELTMLATSGTNCATIAALKEKGVGK